MKLIWGQRAKQRYWKARVSVYTPIIPVTITGEAHACKFSRVLQRDKTPRPSGPRQRETSLAAVDDQDFWVSCHALSVPQRLLEPPSWPLDHLDLIRSISQNQSSHAKCRQILFCPGVTRWLGYPRLVLPVKAVAWSVTAAACKQLLEATGERWVQGGEPKRVLT